MKMDDILTEEQLARLQLDEGWRETAAVGAMVLGLLMGTTSPSNADDTAAQALTAVTQVAERPDVRTQIENDLTAAIHKTIDWDKTPWYASKDDVIEKVTELYFDAIARPGAFSKMKTTIAEYLKDPGDVAVLEKMFKGHIGMLTTAAL